MDHFITGKGPAFGAFCWLLARTPRNHGRLRPVGRSRACARGTDDHGAGLGVSKPPRRKLLYLPDRDRRDEVDVLSLWDIGGGFLCAIGPGVVDSGVVQSGVP